MSETIQAAERPYIPTHVLSSEDDATKQPPAPPAPEPAPEPEPEPEPQPAADGADPATAEPTPEQAEEKRATDARRAEQKRIDHLTRQRYAEKARADRAEADRAALEERLRRLENPGQANQPDFDTAVKQRVQAEMQAAETKRQVDSFHDAGRVSSKLSRSSGATRFVSPSPGSLRTALVIPACRLCETRRLRGANPARRS